MGLLAAVWDLLVVAIGLGTSKKVARALPVLPVEECVPICIKSSHLRSRLAISTTLEAVRKVAPGQIKSSRIEREPHYAERSDFRTGHSAQRSPAPVQFGATLFDLGRLYARPRA